MNDYYIGCIPSWELAFYIASKLNKITKRVERFRNGKLVPFPEVKPEDILSMKPSRKELEFYYEKMCMKGEIL